MFVVSCVILPFLLESYRGSLKLVLFFAPFTLTFVQYLYDDSTSIIYLFSPVFFFHFLLMLWYIYVSFIHSFIHSGHFYSAPSSPLPLRGAPDYSTDTVSEFHAEAHRQLQVKDLP